LEPENLAGMLDAQKILKIYPPEAGVPKPREGFSLTGESEEEPEIELEQPLLYQQPQSPPQSTEKYYVYVITNRQRKTLYVGITWNIRVRIFEHIHHLLPGIPRKRKLNRLVYYQAVSELSDALILQEKIERFTFMEKKEFISKHNPRWRDFADELVSS